MTLHLMEEREKEKKDPQEEGKLRAIALRLCKIKKLFAVDIEEKDSEVRLRTQTNSHSAAQTLKHALSAAVYEGRVGLPCCAGPTKGSLLPTHPPSPSLLSWLVAL